MPSDFQTSVLDNIALTVGGTQPDATGRPRWFSGDQVGDATGLQPGAGYPTFKGCYSAPPEAIEDYPVGIVLMGPFEIRGGDGREGYMQGVEANYDDVSLWIVMGRQDSETTFTDLNPYRDLVPAIFAAHMTANGIPNVIQAMVRSGKPRSLTFGKGDSAITYDCIEFVIRVHRMIPRVYTA